MIEKATLDLTNYFDFISPDAIRIKGHRIGIEHILKYFLDGYQPKDIAAEYPGLGPEKIYACITLYLTNKVEIDEYLLRRRARDMEAYQQWTTAPSTTIERLRIVREEQSKYE